MSTINQPLMGKSFSTGSVFAIVDKGATDRGYKTTYLSVHVLKYLNTGWTGMDAYDEVWTEDPNLALHFPTCLLLRAFIEKAPCLNKPQDRDYFRRYLDDVQLSGPKFNFQVA